jgi:hypothetical protein
VEDQALKWWHVRWGLAGRIVSRFAIVSGKVIGLLCLIAGVGWGALYLLQPWLASQRFGKVDPRMSLVPVSVSSKAEAILSNSSIEHHGFKFRLPNKEIVRTTKIEQTTLVQFPNGMLEFPRPSHDEDWIVFNKSVLRDDDAEKLLSQEMLHSQFKLMQAAMLVTPEQVKWWRFRSSQNERAELLLLVKFLVLTESSSAHAFTIRPIYTIASGEFRGYQLGNPDVPPYDTHINLFDGADRHLAFDIWGLEGHGQVLTQEEINAMVASIRPTTDH